MIEFYFLTIFFQINSFDNFFPLIVCLADYLDHKQRKRSDHVEYLTANDLEYVLHMWSNNEKTGIFLHVRITHTHSLALPSLQWRALLTGIRLFCVWFGRLTWYCWREKNSNNILSVERNQFSFHSKCFLEWKYSNRFRKIVTELCLVLLFFVYRHGNLICTCEENFVCKFVYRGILK